MCNCINQLEDKALVLFKQDYPKDIPTQSVMVHQAILFDSGKTIHYIPITVRYSKGKLHRTKEYKFFYKYCPICGEEIK